MKLTGELKKNVEAANTPEEARAVLEKAGIILTDEEMEAIAGGFFACALKETTASGNNSFINMMSIMAGNDPFDPDPEHSAMRGGFPTIPIF